MDELEKLKKENKEIRSQIEDLVTLVSSQFELTERLVTLLEKETKNA